MRKKRGWRRAAAFALSAVLLAGTALALYDAIWPQQSGTDVLTSKSLVVDAGNAAQGYILAHAADLPASEPSLQYHLSLHCCVVLEYS